MPKHNPWLQTKEAREKNRQSLIESYRTGKTKPYWLGKSRPEISKVLKELHKTGRMNIELRYGKDNPEWKGDDASYSAIHHLLSTNYGKATRCENLVCAFKNPQRYEWAYLGNNGYSRNKKDYVQLCASCHRKMDLSGVQPMLHGYNLHKYKQIWKMQS